MALPGSPSRWWRIAASTAMVGVAVATGPVVAASTASAAPAGMQISSTGLTSGAIKHTWLIILENKSFDATFTGLNNNSYLWRTLPGQGVLLKNYYGTSHFSQGNYESLVSGQASVQDVQSDCPTSYKDFTSTVVTDPTSPNYGQAASTAGPNAPNPKNGCVYPASVPTLFNQFDSSGVSWKGYGQDIGLQANREATACAGPGAATNNPTNNPTSEQSFTAGSGITSYTGAQPNDQYVAKHFPFPWFHSLIDQTSSCDNTHIANLDGPTGTYTGTGLASDLAKPAAQVPGFSWISPNNCSDAHDAVCRGNNLSGAFNPDGTPNYAIGSSTAYNPQAFAPTNFTGGLYASDLFLKYYIPLIEQSAAFKDGGLIDVTFDEANPPFTYTGNSFYNSQTVPATAATGLVSDAAGETINNKPVATEPAGPNSPLGNYPDGSPFPGPGDSAFVNRLPGSTVVTSVGASAVPGSRTDTNGASSGNGQTKVPVGGDPSSNLITDGASTIVDQGRTVTGTNIPSGAFVGQVSDIGTTATASFANGGQAVSGAFSLVDAMNNPVTPTGPVSAVTLGARTPATDPLYDGTSQTPGGGRTGSVLISPMIRPGTTSTVNYDHYSWLRTMEDIYGVSSGTSNGAIAGGAGSVSGGIDGQGHLGYASTSGLAPFGPDVFNNATPPAVTPEAPLAVGLPVAGLLAVGGYLVIRNRRRHLVAH